MNSSNASDGFSLVELVTVILLLGIVSAVVLPRFTSRDGFVEYAVRDQFISAFRFAQQRAMYDHSGSCYSVDIDANGFSPNKDGASFSNFEPVDFSAGDYTGASITQGGSSTFSIYFDGLGNAYTGNAVDCGTSLVSDPLTLDVSSDAAAINIYPTGFIQ